MIEIKQRPSINFHIGYTLHRIVRVVLLHSLLLDLCESLCELLLLLSFLFFHLFQLLLTLFSFFLSLVFVPLLRDNLNSCDIALTLIFLIFFLFFFLLLSWLLYN